MNFTNSELIQLIGITHVDLCGLKGTIKRQEKIIIDCHKENDDQQIIDHCIHTLKLLEKRHKENTALKEKLIKQFYSQGGKEEQI